MTLTISKFRRLLPLLAAAVFTVGCAPLTVAIQGRIFCRPRPYGVALGRWQDLGTSEEAIAGSGGRIELQTRMWGGTAQGDWLAVARADQPDRRSKGIPRALAIARLNSTSR